MLGTGEPLSIVEHQAGKGQRQHQLQSSSVAEHQAGMLASRGHIFTHHQEPKYLARNANRVPILGIIFDVSEK